MFELQFNVSLDVQMRTNEILYTPKPTCTPPSVA